MIALFKILTKNTTILTPNRRLAASVTKQYTAWKIENKETCWHTLDILPLFPSWLERIWKNYLANHFTENSYLLSHHQEQILWEKILRESPQENYLLHTTHTAKLAKSAWEILKRWKVTIYHPALNTTEDSQAFLQWANTFQTLCTEHHWIDQNSLADKISTEIDNKKITVPEKIILLGFTELAPQYQYLLKTFEKHGSQIQHHTLPIRNKKTQTISLTDTETELYAMARWAKSLSEHSLSIGCIIPNLESQREIVVRIFSEIFNENEFNISAGKPLSHYPIIHTALQLLNLDNTKKISINHLSHLLRSPFLGEAERERWGRALFENRLHYSNINAILLKQLINPHDKNNILKFSPLLAQRLEYFIKTVSSQPKKMLISEWIILFTELLSVLGWPGERRLNSHEYQVVHNCWLIVLTDLTKLDHVLEPINYATALHYLTCIANSTVFQPESPSHAPVHILGLLEAAGMPFEHAWVMGLDDTTWPARPKPNPFIPLHLQKLLNMPNASSERELTYCQELTTQLQNSSENIIFSHPSQLDDAELRPSALIKNFSSITLNELSLSEFMPSAEIIAQSQQLEFLTDEIAPPVSTEDIIAGGVSIFKKQAECPFKAFSELRLHAKKMQDITLGLRPQDRGEMVHKALELIWEQLKDWNTLTTKTNDQLQKIIEQCTIQALTDFTDLTIENQSRYFSLELQRLKKIITQWLDFEKLRAPFTVSSIEKKITVTLGEITTTVRIDRIDELEDGSYLIIDYKTGKQNDYKKWFGERPDEPQLPFYCILNKNQISGIAFAQIHPDEIELTGASHLPSSMKSIKTLAEIKHADATLWEEQLKIWRKNLNTLGENFIKGHAETDPKDPNLTCRQCNLHAFCRIHELNTIDEDHDE